MLCPTCAAMAGEFSEQEQTGHMEGCPLHPVNLASVTDRVLSGTVFGDALSNDLKSDLIEIMNAAHALIEEKGTDDAVPDVR